MYPPLYVKALFCDFKKFQSSDSADGDKNYNMDETLLLFKASADRSLVQAGDNASSTKMSKERVILVAARRRNQHKGSRHTDCVRKIDPSVTNF